MKCYTLRANPKNLLATVEKAKALFGKGGDTEVTLALCGGNYTLTEPITFDAADFGGKCRLRLVGGERIRTVISSLVSIPHARWEAVEGQPYYICRLTPGQNIRALYVDGKLAPLSTTKGFYKTFWPFKRPDGSEYIIMQDKLTSEYGDRIYIPEEPVLQVGAENCRGAELHMCVEWEFKIYHIDHIDLDDVYVDPKGVRHVTVQLDKSETKYGNRWIHVCDRPFEIKNATAPTTPGEYAYNKKEGILYYCPEGKMEDHTFALPAAANLFTFKNFKELSLYGITFTGVEDEIYTDYGYYAGGQAGVWERYPDGVPHSAAVTVQSLGGGRVENCVFHDLPCDALLMRGNLTNVTVRSCRFETVGATALRVFNPIPNGAEGCIDPAVYHEHIRGLLIENNYVHLTGFRYRNCCAITVGCSLETRIVHNTVLESTYSAISIGWRWTCGAWEYREKYNLRGAEVAYNYVTSFMTGMRDGGGIYTLGGNVTQSHEALFNHLHDNVVIEDERTCPTNGFFASIYHDGASSNWYDYNNIVVHNPARKGSYNSARIYLQRVGEPFQASTYNQNDWHILLENNYICCADNFGDVYRSQDFDREGATDMLDYTRHLRERNTHLLPSVRALKRIPEARAIWNAAGCRLQ
ncbi:MAG: right-handed parallel beta-helix repeat-containing protein [Clostridia bacterium]|nr:right-handed parallel beta-helix repeat-containing protein [Clostridia bacterium]